MPSTFFKIALKDPNDPNSRARLVMPIPMIGGGPALSSGPASKAILALDNTCQSNRAFRDFQKHLVNRQGRFQGSPIAQQLIGLINDFENKKALADSVGLTELSQTYTQLIQDAKTYKKILKHSNFLKKRAHGHSLFPRSFQNALDGHTMHLALPYEDGGEIRSKYHKDAFVARRTKRSRTSQAKAPSERLVGNNRASIRTQLVNHLNETKIEAVLPPIDHILSGEVFKDAQESAISAMEMSKRASPKENDNPTISSPIQEIILRAMLYTKAFTEQLGKTKNSAMKQQLADFVPIWTACATEGIIKAMHPETLPGHTGDEANKHAEKTLKMTKTLIITIHRRMRHHSNEPLSKVINTCYNNYKADQSVESVGFLSTMEESITEAGVDYDDETFCEYAAYTVKNTRKIQDDVVDIFRLNSPSSKYNFLSHDFAREKYHFNRILADNPKEHLALWIQVFFGVLNMYVRSHQPPCENPIRHHSPLNMAKRLETNQELLVALCECVNVSARNGTVALIEALSSFIDDKHQALGLRAALSPQHKAAFLDDYVSVSSTMLSADYLDEITYFRSNQNSPCYAADNGAISIDAAELSSAFLGGLGPRIDKHLKRRLSEFQKHNQVSPNEYLYCPENACALWNYLNNTDIDFAVRKSNIPEFFSDNDTVSTQIITEAYKAHIQAEPPFPSLGLMAIALHKQAKEKSDAGEDSNYDSELLGYLLDHWYTTEHQTTRDVDENGDSLFHHITFSFPELRNQVQEIILTTNAALLFARNAQGKLAIDPLPYDSILAIEDKTQRPLSKAIEANDTGLIESILASYDADALKVMIADESALTAIIEKGNAQAALAVIASMDPEDLNKQNGLGDTAMGLATKQHLDPDAPNMSAVIEAIVTKTPDTELGNKDIYDKTMLLHLVTTDATDDLILSLTKRMQQEDIEKQGVHYKSAPELIIESGREELALAMIADMDMNKVSDSFIFSCSYAAAKANSVKILQIILSKKTIDQATKIYQLKGALEYNSQEAAIYLIGELSHFNLATALDQTPLMRLIVNEGTKETFAAAIDKLIEHMGNLATVLTETDDLGQTLFEIIAQYKNQDAIAYLTDIIILQDNIDPDTVLRALSTAAICGDLDSFSKLLAYVNEKNLIGPNDFTKQLFASKRTLAHHAAIGGNPEIMRCVIGKMTPADLAIVDSEGNTALILATHYKNAEAGIALTEGMEPQDLLIRGNNDLSALTLINNNKLDTLFLVFVQQCNLIDVSEDDLGSLFLSLAKHGLWDLVLPHIQKCDNTDLYLREVLSNAIETNHWEAASALIEYMHPSILAIKDHTVESTQEYNYITGRYEPKKIYVTPLVQMLLKANNEASPEYLAATQKLISKMASESLSINENVEKYLISDDIDDDDRFFPNKVDLITLALHKKVDASIIKALLDGMDYSQSAALFYQQLKFAIHQNQVVSAIVILEKAKAMGATLIDPTSTRFTRRRILNEVIRLQRRVENRRVANRSDNDKFLSLIFDTTLGNDALTETTIHGMTWLHEIAEQPYLPLLRAFINAIKARDGLNIKDCLSKKDNWGCSPLELLFSRHQYSIIYPEAHISESTPPMGTLHAALTLLAEGGILQVKTIILRASVKGAKRALRQPNNDLTEGETTLIPKIKQELWARTQLKYTAVLGFSATVAAIVLGVLLILPITWAIVLGVAAGVTGVNALIKLYNRETYFYSSEPKETPAIVPPTVSSERFTVHNAAYAPATDPKTEPTTDSSPAAGPDQN